MTSLAKVREQVDELSPEDREGLLAYLIHSLPEPPSGPDEEEILRREFEMDSGIVKPISHEQFLKMARGEE